MARRVFSTVSACASKALKLLIGKHGVEGEVGELHAEAGSTAPRRLLCCRRVDRQRIEPC
jgi:hypothetical protein